MQAEKHRSEAGERDNQICTKDQLTVWPAGPQCRWGLMSNGWNTWESCVQHSVAGLCNYQLSFVKGWGGKPPSYQRKLLGKFPAPRGIESPEETGRAAIVSPTQLTQIKLKHSTPRHCLSSGSSPASVACGLGVTSRRSPPPPPAPGLCHVKVKRTLRDALLLPQSSMVTSHTPTPLK